MTNNPICDSYFGIVQDQHICISGAQGSGTCNGDSGGPLMSGNRLIGIASFGAQGCLRGYPSGFTRVEYYLDWLEVHMS
ncbi:hypothetical protein NQ314_020883 [Rhamnusium bicolor]|uniref:Peptidase S1 domain-containing protein n=1 Tax=Rhamnusium bicolor TaxID=1586634 RepID=A0AAV8WKL7_9CUCU|nr:hypothetical protein NQ314_020883 [Rhamnusium bicolor]